MTFSPMTWLSSWHPWPGGARAGKGEKGPGLREEEEEVEGIPFPCFLLSLLNEREGASAAGEKKKAKSQDNG